MDDIEFKQRRARLRDPLTYGSVSEWFADYRGFVPIQMAKGLSDVMRAHGITFAEAYRLLRDAGAIIEIEYPESGPDEREVDAGATGEQHDA